MSKPLLNAQPSSPNGPSVRTLSTRPKIRRLSTMTPKKRRATPSERAFDNLYFDGRHFWHPHPTVQWQQLNISGVTRLLCVDYGLSEARPNSGPSQIDFVLVRVQEEHRICPASRWQRRSGPHSIPKALRDKNVGGLGAIRNRPPEGDDVLGTDSNGEIPVIADHVSGPLRAASKRGRR
jgi:hypothetical protein